jgi:hypothetical protein
MARRPDVFNQRAFEYWLRQQGCPNSLISPIISDLRLLIPIAVWTVGADRLLQVAEDLRDELRLGEQSAFWRLAAHYADVWASDQLIKYSAARTLEDSLEEISDRESPASDDDPNIIDYQRPRRKPVADVVWEAALELTGGDNTVEFAPRHLIPIILSHYPDFKLTNIGPELAAGSVNSRSRHHFSNVKDRYWWVRPGRYRLI